MKYVPARAIESSNRSRGLLYWVRWLFWDSVEFTDDGRYGSRFGLLTGLGAFVMGVPFMLFSELENNELYGDIVAFMAAWFIVDFVRATVSEGISRFRKSRRQRSEGEES